MKQILIGGCDRSGTTMLGSLLGGHERVVCIPESQFILSTLSKPNNNSNDSESIIDAIKNDFSFILWELDLDKCNCKSDLKDVSSIVEWIVCCYKKISNNHDADIWVDHTPWNIRHTKTLFDLFPDAKLLHLIRDGRAVAASFKKTKWGPYESFASANYWIEQIAHGLSAESYWGAERVLRVRFEDLVRYPERTVKRICDFVQLDFDPSMLEGTGFKRPLYTADEHLLIGKPPDNTRIDSWKNDLSPRQTEIFESIACDLLSLLGYRPIYGKEARQLRGPERIRASFIEMLNREVLNRVAGKVRRSRILRTIKSKNDK